MTAKIDEIIRTGRFQQLEHELRNPTTKVRAAVHPALGCALHVV